MHKYAARKLDTIDLVNSLPMSLKNSLPFVFM